jgi:hypothetical protein
MTRNIFRPLIVLGVLFVFGLCMSSRAVADDADPPGRVARLSLTTGEVSFSPAGTDDWVSAVINRPLTTGDKLWADRDARAELHVGSAVFRISGMTGFSFLNLSDKMIQIRLSEGTLNFSVRRLGDDEAIEIDTPNLAFSALRPGHYRVNVNEAGDATIINVRDGQGEVTGGGSAYTIHAGEQAILSGTDELNADIEAIAAEDDFDSWCNERDLREEHAASRRYVSDDVIGYEDLDDYGGWRPVPEYGTVWFPHVSVVNWAPYRYGHWAWISPWGWTWVDDAPWGFAPFHYGRWVSVRGAWGWVPCPPPVVAVAYVRPVYAPALVAWLGGPHFGIGVAVGGAAGVGVNVGWFPLGPREVYVPSYHVSRVYVNNVNISNTNVNQTVINNYYNTTVVNRNVTVNNVRYINQGVAGGVTATSGQNFTTARPVYNNMVRVDQREIASAPVQVGAPAVAPPRQAVMGSGVETRYHPPAMVQNRAVVAKTAPPPPPPPFARQQAAIQANEGRPISVTQERQIQPENTRVAAAPVRMAPAATVVNPRLSRGNNVSGTMNRNAEPGPLNTNRPVNANPTGNAPQVNSNAQSNGNRPSSGNANANPNAPQAPQAPNQRAVNDRPPSARPNNNSVVDPRLEQKHQQQNQALQQKQDRERQKVDEQRYQQEQKLQRQNADDNKQKQVEAKQQEKLQQMETKHGQQQQQLKQKQEVEHEQAHPHSQPAPKPKPSEDKPHK